MRVNETTVKAAFDEYSKHYAEGRAWGIDHHVEMWNLARQAFRHGSFDAFHTLYEKLRSRWQVFRGTGDHWPDRKVYDTLLACDQRIARCRLSSICKDDLPSIWAAIQAVKSIKVNQTGPSVVAVSKFLHFRNPRLFVIVDDGLVWKWVFGHSWLREQVESIRKETDCLIGHSTRHADSVCDLPTYLAVLAWASRLVRDNPCITPAFYEHVRRHANKVTVSPEVAEYDAAALEWFLLGLVALPPVGVDLRDT